MESKELVNLLLVSEDEYLIQTFSQELPKWGVNVNLTSDIEGIYQQVNEITTDILLLDGDMLLSDSEIPSLREIQGLEKRPEVIICIGSKVDQRLSSLIEGMKDIYFISKPVLPRSMLSLIEEISHKRVNRVGLPFKKELLKNILLNSERRDYIRAKVNLPLSCLFLNKAGHPPLFCEVKAWARNVSCTGIMLETQQEISFPPVIGIELSLPSTSPTLRIDGEVKWKSAGRNPNRQYMGIKFKDPSEQSQNLIARYVYSAINRDNHPLEM